LLFLIDENLPRTLVDVCRECGHEAVHVRDVGLGETADPKSAASPDTTASHC
jgi:predicted nuclease of predicted toxin-antitoxin system